MRWRQARGGGEENAIKDWVSLNLCSFDPHIYDTGNMCHPFFEGEKVKVHKY